MPTYEYRCASCEHQFERFQRMSDDPITECELCGGSVKRLLFPVAIHFKGNGFYTTDYARRNVIGAGSAAGSGASPDGGGPLSASGDGDMPDASVKKPAGSVEKSGSEVSRGSSGAAASTTTATAGKQD